MIFYQKKEAEEEEKKKEIEKTGKKVKAPPKKQDKKQLKKGEVPENLISPREILEFKLGHDDLIVFKIDELVRHHLRNAI